MKVAFVCSEVAPWCKTGGLGDVCGSLPDALAGLDVSVSVFAPLYRRVREHAEKKGLVLEETGVSVQVAIGLDVFSGTFRVFQGPAPIYFLDIPSLYDREGIYGETEDSAYGAAGSYTDNLTRFTVLGLAVQQGVADLIGQWPDLFHLHDWQSARVAGSLKKPAASVLTIHNLSYQGVFIEKGSVVNLLAEGISSADVVTTVSPSYAEEITTPEMGCGLEGALAACGVVGVVNGVDTTVWTPSGNSYIAADYSAEDLSGKHACRQALLDEFGLVCDEGDIILGVVARFASQKGLDLVLELIPHLGALQARLVVLGTGSPGLETAFAQASQKHADRVSVALKFDVGLAHRITAGADVFLMPSRFEPCGLNQLYAMAYGTPPVVHAVGGLKDTVIDPGDAALMKGEGTGFAFHRPASADLHGAVFRAAHLFRTDPEGWKRLQKSGMQRDFSWGPSAEKWKALYDDAIGRMAN